MKKSLYKIKSSLHGSGLFENRDIKKSEQVNDLSKDKLLDFVAITKSTIPLLTNEKLLQSDTKEQINSIKSNSILIGQFDPFSNKEIINKLIKKNNKIEDLLLSRYSELCQGLKVLEHEYYLKKEEIIDLLLKKYDQKNI